MNYVAVNIKLNGDGRYRKKSNKSLGKTMKEHPLLFVVLFCPMTEFIRRLPTEIFITHISRYFLVLGA